MSLGFSMDYKSRIQGKALVSGILSIHTARLKGV
jgi:hypothetical protein